MRQVARVVPTELGAHLDILWFAVPRRVDDPPLSGLDVRGPGTRVCCSARTTPGRSATTSRRAAWPGCGRPASPRSSRRSSRPPWLRDRLAALTDVNQLTLLPVRITALDRWTEPGLLLIGDAAHVISPVGGNGMNFALADAAEAANALVPALAQPAAEVVDRTCRDIEARRRVVSDGEQQGQVRAEADSVERMRRGEPDPPWIMKLAAAVPPLARRFGRRGATGITIPPPSPAVLGSAGDLAPTR